MGRTGLGCVPAAFGPVVDLAAGWFEHRAVLNLEHAILGIIVIRDRPGDILTDFLLRATCQEGIRRRLQGVTPASRVFGPQ